MQSQSSSNQIKPLFDLKVCLGKSLVRVQKKQESMRRREYGKNKQWSMVEEIKYSIFLEKFKDGMEGKAHSLLWNVYKQMEKFLKTRNFRQCKIKHQSLLLQHKNAENIIEHIMTKHQDNQEAISKQRENLKIMYGEKQKQNQKNKSALEIEVAQSKVDKRPTDHQYIDRNYEENQDNEIQQYVDPFQMDCLGFKPSVQLDRWVNLFQNFPSHIKLA